MKKILLMFIVIILVGGTVGAQDIAKTATTWGFYADVEERWQVGMLLGLSMIPVFLDNSFSFSSGVTAGYRWTPKFETNIAAGYAFTGYEAPMLMANGLITISSTIFDSGAVARTSVGPQGNFVFSDPLGIAVLGMLRTDHIFATIPMNAFIEAGFGYNFLSSSFAMQLSAGLTYMF